MTKTACESRPGSPGSRPRRYRAQQQDADPACHLPLLGPQQHTARPPGPPRPARRYVMRFSPDRLGPVPPRPAAVAPLAARPRPQPGPDSSSEPPEPDPGHGVLGALVQDRAGPGPGGQDVLDEVHLVDGLP